MPSPQVWLRNTIEAAAGCNAYPKDAPDDAVVPYVVYERSATSRPLALSDTLDNQPSGSAQSPTAAISLQVFAADYLEAWQKSDAIVAAVHCYSGSGDGITVESSIVVDEKDGEPLFYEGEDAPVYVVEIALELRWS